jgi:hypothetical protein
MEHQNRVVERYLERHRVEISEVGFVNDMRGAAPLSGETIHVLG